MDRPSSLEWVGVGVLLCTLSVNLNLWILIPNSVYSGSGAAIIDEIVCNPNIFYNLMGTQLILVLYDVVSSRQQSILAPSWKTGKGVHKQVRVRERQAVSSSRWRALIPRPTSNQEALNGTASGQ